MLKNYVLKIPTPFGDVHITDKDKINNEEESDLIEDASENIKREEIKEAGSYNK